MIRDATPADAAAIAEIYNEAVLNSTAIWNDVVVDADNRVRWIAAHHDAGVPVLVLEEQGEVTGYATYGAFRSFDGYRETVEHSLYIRADKRGGGRGRMLMEALIAFAREDGRHIMVAAIEAENAASIHLHERLGFVPVGRMPEVGQKFGRWLDLALLQLKLDDRTAP
ncbi:acetyltransferase [Paenirhodobacter enshiensis]|uniref:Acetyltransferase n=2 Tax=Paenirhodobacter enshiensis TaxID=1105367 RepID=A0A086XVV0_9RHOB|nr:GNAT family N-acetyltransferase [Paenirhodobacter enshiensis]KFI26150.1 acetyltransferase [Paenirhodobacter enshiensis]